MVVVQFGGWEWGLTNCHGKQLYSMSSRLTVPYNNSSHTLRHLNSRHFKARSKNFEKRLLASSYLPVRPSIRMEQLGSYCTDFHGIWYFGIFRQFVQKIQVSLKSDKNKGYFTWRRIYIFILSRSVLLRMKRFSEKHCTETRNTHFVFKNFFSPSKIVPFMR